MFFACVRKIIGNSHSVIGAMSFARCFLETRVEDQRKHYIVWLGRCFWHLGALPTQRATWKSRVHYYPLGDNVRGSEKSAGGELICHFSYHQVACIRTQSHYSTRWVLLAKAFWAHMLSVRNRTQSHWTCHCKLFKVFKVCEKAPMFF